LAILVCDEPLVYVTTDVIKFLDSVTDAVLTLISLSNSLDEV